MASRFQRSFELTRACFTALRKEPTLMAFPIISGVATLLAAATFLVPAILWAVASTPAHGHVAGAASHLGSIALGFAFYFCTTFITLFFNAALVHAALRALEGQHTTVGDGVRFALSRIGVIAAYAALAAVVSTLLKEIEHRSSLVGKIVVAIIGVAWTFATYLAVPVLVVEGTGPIETVKRSTRLFKETWGEQLLSRLGFGLAGVAAAVVITATLAGGVFLGVTAGWAAGAPVIGLAVLLIAAWAVTVSALNSLWTAALYRYATVGEVAPHFPASCFPRR